jgi:Xaa-Pro aminopeptidase
VSDVLIIGDTIRCPELRHEIPVAVPDPFVYAEHGGKQLVLVGGLEVPRIEAAGAYEVHPPEDYGIDELLRSGLTRDEISLEVTLRACRAWEVEDAAVPPTFPLEIADHLRANGIEVHADRDLFVTRRRSKNADELAGIRRAQQAAEAGMTAARELLRRARPDNGAVNVDGEPLTCERLKIAIENAFTEHASSAEEFIVSHGPQTAIGHDMGSGPIAADEPIVIDLFPRDRESACFADMTRTYVVGTPSDELKEYHRLCHEAILRALEGVRPGAEGHALHVGTCELFQENGHKTLLDKEPGKVLEDGFFHSLGHGVGLEVHERPTLGVIPGDTLVAGDVVTLEPGLYRRGYGGVRLEDLVLVTEDGAENLTRYPYDLEP